MTKRLPFPSRLVTVLRSSHHSLCRLLLFPAPKKCKTESLNEFELLIKVNDLSSSLTNLREKINFNQAYATSTRRWFKSIANSSSSFTTRAFTLSIVINNEDETSHEIEETFIFGWRVVKIWFFGVNWIFIYGGWEKSRVNNSIFGSDL